MPASLHETFLVNVRRRMAELKINQREVAKRLGISDASVSQLLNAQFQPSPKVIEKVAKALRCNWLYLVTPVESDEIPEILEKTA